MYIKINTYNRINIINSKKDFILFNLNKDGSLKSFKLTNDLQRYKKKYDNFRVLSCIKNELKQQLINI
jgi:hypothetical protein